MGCDIHLYVERREAGKWVSADTWEPNRYEEEGTVSVPYGKHYYDGRNYDTFAILADVRNGEGFAGVDTGEGFVPICAPKGLPNDLSPELAAYIATGAVDHTPSWLTVAEMLAYDWTRVTTKRGTVSAVEYHSWMMQRGRGDRGPSSYSGDVWGGNVVKIEPEEMERRIAKLVQNRGGRHWDALDDVKSSMQSVYTRVSWQTPYYRAASTFLSECLPRLWKLGKPEDVRIVFWFDN